MSVVTLKAHFDGQAIQLDEPYELRPNTQLIVTVLPPAAEDEVRAGWATLSARGLANAYGEDEPEYTAADIQP